MSTDSNWAADGLQGDGVPPAGQPKQGVHIAPRLTDQGREDRQFWAGQARDRSTMRDAPTCARTTRLRMREDDPLPVRDQLLAVDASGQDHSALDDLPSVDVVIIATSPGTRGLVAIASLLPGEHRITAIGLTPLFGVWAVRHGAMQCHLRFLLVAGTADSCPFGRVSWVHVDWGRLAGLAVEPR